MSKYGCVRAEEILSQLRSGPLGPELLEHTLKCADCADLMTVVNSLRREAELLAQTPIPGAGEVWRKAQLRSTHDAVEWAIWPIRLVTGFSCAAGLATLLWLLFDSHMIRNWPMEIADYCLRISRSETAFDANLAVVGIACAFLCVFLASFYLLWQEVRSL